MHFQGLLGGQLVGLDMRLVWLAHFLPLPCSQTLPWPCHPSQWDLREEPFLGGAVRNKDPLSAVDLSRVGAD